VFFCFCLDVIFVSVTLNFMDSLPKTGSGMISASAGWCRQGSAEKRFLSMEIVMMPCVKQRSRLRNRSGISGTVGGALAAILSWVPCGSGYGQAESGSSTNMSQPARPPSIIVSCYMITREASLYSYKGSNTSVGAVLLVNCRWAN
jgi:hypothetical protein